MTASIGIFSWMLLVLLGPLQCSGARPDLQMTPCDDVLAGETTPIYFMVIQEPDDLGRIVYEYNYTMINFLGRSSKYKRDRPYEEDNRCPNTIPWTIYPRVLIIIGWDIYLRYGEDPTKLLEYVMAFWNDVDMDFRTLEEPRLRLHIAGIVIMPNPDVIASLTPGGQDSEMIDYMEMNPDQRQSLARYWRNSVQHRFQIITFMTSNNKMKHLLPFTERQLKRINSNAPAEAPSPLQIGPYTLVDERRTMCEHIVSIGVAQWIIFKENRRWWATHELAEALAKSFVSSVPGSNGTTCPRHESGVLIGFSGSGSNLPDWSDCYLESFEKRFNKKETTCFIPRPNVPTPLRRISLGQILTVHEQCSVFDDSPPCPFINDRICQDLTCKTTNFMNTGRPSYKADCQYIGIPAADGTPCGHGKVCFRRRCIWKHGLQDLSLWEA